MLTALFAIAYFPSLFDTLETHSHFWLQTMRSQDLALFPYLSCGALLLSLAFSFAMFVFRFLRLFQKMPLFQKPRRKIYRCRFCAGRRRHDPKKRFQTVSSRRRFWWQLWWTLMFAYIHPFYSCPLKAYPSNIFDTMSSFPAVSRFRLPRCFRFLRGPWFIPRKLRNKMMHAKNGNTFSPFAASSGKGRGKSQNQGQRQQVFTQVTPELQEEWFQQAIKDSLPEAAQRRLAPRLEPAEWSVPTFHHTEMTNTGGICICPKQEIPDLLRRIGYTKAPAAMLCTQHPSEIALKGYPAQELTCTFHIKDNDGAEKAILVRRFLVQIGFGQFVTQQVDGDLVNISTPMHKVTIKLPFIHGWRSESCTVQSIAKILDQRIPNPSYDQIVVRQDQSATVLVHESEVLNLLKTSGREAVFLKLHESSSLLPNPDILWLPPEFSLDDAIVLAQQDDKALGIVSKNSRLRPRYAVRFGQKEDLQRFAKANNIEDLSTFGRWRLTGLPVQTGSVGALQLLESRGWDIKEILFLNDSQCSFLSSKRGNISNMYYIDGGIKHPLQIKAVNAIARDEQASANKAAASKAAPKLQTSRPATAVQKDTWTRAIAAKASLQAPASPRRSVNQEPSKRTTDSKTGNTPDHQKQRTE